MLSSPAQIATGLLDPCVMYPAYLRCLGATIGGEVYISGMVLRAGVDMITIGDKFVTGDTCLMECIQRPCMGSTVVFAPIVVGNECTFGHDGLAPTPTLPQSFNHPG